MKKSPIISSGVILGTGLGGLIDGILLHQIFQVHSMFSAKLPLNTLVNVKVNMFWDGIFSWLCWVICLIGVITLFRTARNQKNLWSGKVLTGAMLLGWGLFNFVEGLLDHHLLGIHHVVERLGISLFDYIFLGSGIFLIMVGSALMKSYKRVTSDVTL
ncbi:MAG TPA: DUF2243 domain-containing protein [Xanthomonadales bacterium]|nr:DUF2243 domain-containing protein [Xanthomonadales bacterium]